MSIIDCRGLVCPAPVIATKKAAEESKSNSFKVILDNGPPVENVIRFCKSHNYIISSQIQSDSWTTITVTRDAGDQDISGKLSAGDIPVILVSSDKLGNGPEDLGRLLIKNFFITIIESQRLPGEIYLINSGVLLATQGSELIEPLTRLSISGVEIYSCGVCLDYFGVKDKLAIGKITNMYTIIESLMSENKILHI